MQLLVSHRLRLGIGAKHLCRFAQYVSARSENQRKHLFDQSHAATLC